MVEIALNGIHKKYENNENYSVTDFNLHIKDREFIVFVGPSGCGKSTTLRMIAGLEDISEGEFLIDGKLMNDVAPKDRDIAMVFQNYALYPHMTVFDNMAFGLKLRKFDKNDIKNRVENAAEILGLTEYLHRKPSALSGGQRQRVALGRAIVRDAQVFLMDEAMTMADRIVIMKDGFIQQIGSPQEVYNTPKNVFVAGFIGYPAMNFFTVRLSNGCITNEHGLNLRIPQGRNKVLVEKGYEGKEMIFGIRPEDIHTEQIVIDATPEATVRSEIVVSELLGTETMLYSKIGDTEFVSRVDARDFHQPGEKIDLAFDLNKSHFFDSDTQEAITLP